MFECEDRDDEEIQVSSETRLKKISATLKWIIKNFHSLSLSANKTRFPILKSSQFFLQDNTGEKSFQIFFQYDYQTMQVKSSPELPKYATVVCSILDKNAKVAWRSQMFIPPLFRVNLPISTLLQFTQKSTLVVIFRIEIIEDLVTEYVTNLKTPPIFSNLEKFLEDQTICDVTFLVDNHEFKAHKVILAARSPVFLAMFSHEFSEQKSNRVTISDVKPRVFEALLRYVYNADVKNIQEIAIELMIAADKYFLQELKIKCEKILIDEMLDEKAVHLLQIAIRHKCSNLEACCRSFLSKNNSRKDDLKNP